MSRVRVRSRARSPSDAFPTRAARPARARPPARASIRSPALERPLARSTVHARAVATTLWRSWSNAWDLGAIARRNVPILRSVGSNPTGVSLSTARRARRHFCPRPRATRGRDARDVAGRPSSTRSARRGSVFARRARRFARSFVRFRARPIREANSFVRVFALNAREDAREGRERGHERTTA